MGIPIDVAVKLPKGLNALDFDRKTVMGALRQQARKIQKASKQLVSAKGPSQPGQYPGRDSGKMRKFIKVHASKKKTKLWTRVQVDTLPDEKFWYPSVLNYGSSKRNIQPRRNAIVNAGEMNATEAQNAIADAMWKGIKGWKP